MEGKSIKEKILYWGGITLISSVIIGGSYYIYKSIFGSDNDDKNNIDDDNDSLGNSFMQSNINKEKNNNINKENNLDNNNIINDINSTIFPKNLMEEDNNNNNKINGNKNNENKENEEHKNQNNPQNSINIFNNNKILLKSFGIIFDESKIIFNNNRLTDESAILIIIYINYLSQKFYLIDNPTLDEKRRSILIKLTNDINKLNNNEINNEINNINSINNINENEKALKEQYLTLCNETFGFQQNSYQMASEKILSCLPSKISIQEIQEFLNNIDKIKFEKISIKILNELNNELFKYDLDIFDVNKAKEAYIYYLTIFNDQAKKLFEEQGKLINNKGEEMEKNEENNLFIFQFITLKIQMDDKLYIKYNIVDEHLKLLIYKYNLINDKEINELQNEFDILNNRLGNLEKS